jgi:hypothetical protein
MSVCIALAGGNIMDWSYETEIMVGMVLMHLHLSNSTQTGVLTHFSRQNRPFLHSETDFLPNLKS